MVDAYKIWSDGKTLGPYPYSSYSFSSFEIPLPRVHEFLLRRQDVALHLSSPALVFARFRLCRCAGQVQVFKTFQKLSDISNLNPNLGKALDIFGHLPHLIRLNTGA